MPEGAGCVIVFSARGSYGVSQLTHAHTNALLHAHSHAAVRTRSCPHVVTSFPRMQVSEMLREVHQRDKDVLQSLRNATVADDVGETRRLTFDAKGLG